WAFYEEFWEAHGLQNLEKRLPAPEISIKAGGKLRIPILINNRTSEPQTVALQVVAPAGWKSEKGDATYSVLANNSYTVPEVLLAPAAPTAPWQELRWKAEVNGKDRSTALLRVNVISHGR